MSEHRRADDGATRERLPHEKPPVEQAKPVAWVVECRGGGGSYPRVEWAMQNHGDAFFGRNSGPSIRKRQREREAQGWETRVVSLFTSPPDTDERLRAAIARLVNIRHRDTGGSPIGQLAQLAWLVEEVDKIAALTAQETDDEEKP